MRLMMKSAVERMLDTEMDVHLGRKTLPGSAGGGPLVAEASDVGGLNPAGQSVMACSSPQVIGKHQRRVPGFDEKMLPLYAKGMTTRDIQEDRAGAVRGGGFRHAALRNHC